MATKREPESLREIFTRDFLVIATINLAMFFGFQMTNVGIPVYVAQLGGGAQVVGMTTTLMTITAVIVRVFAGPLLDRFGRKGALIGGSLLMACSIFSYAVFPVVGIILGVRLLQGIGWGLGSTASSTIAADVIPKRRFAEGMGYFAMTNALSSALAPAVSIALVQGPGAHYMVYVAGGCAALAFVISLFQRNAARNGGDKASSSTDKQAAPTQAGPFKEEPTNSGALEPAKVPSKLEAIFERRALFPGMLMLLVNIGFGIITTFIAVHGQEQGIGHVSAYFIVYAVVTLASRPMIGRIIDRYGYRLPSVLATICTAATLVLIGLSRDMVLLSAAGVLSGLGIGTAMSAFQSMAVAAVEPWRRGVATSTYMVMFDLGIALGALLGGAIADVWGYTAMYLIIAIFPLIACALSAIRIKDDKPNSQL